MLKLSIINNTKYQFRGVGFTFLSRLAEKITHSAIHVSEHLLALFGKSLLETCIKLKQFAFGPGSFVAHED